MNTSSRLGTLEGTLSRKPAPVPAAPPENPSSKDNIASTPKTTKQSGRTVPKREAPKKSSESGGGTRRVAFRLDPELHEALTRRVHEEATSQSHVVLDAIEAAHAANSLTSPAGPEGGEGAGSLFSRPTLKRRATAAVPTEIRVDATTLETIDRLVDETETSNRTELITRALRHHLTS